MINLNFTLLIQLINFLALLFILNQILYKPIIAKMREREARIRQDREQALGLDQKVAAQEAEHQEKLTQARRSATQEKAALMAEAKKKESDVLEKARAEAGKIVDNMRAAIQADAEEVRGTLNAQVTPLAQAITEKILGRPV